MSPCSVEMIPVLNNIHPEIIAGAFTVLTGVLTFIISERYRIRLENKKSFNQAKIELLVYLDTELDIICSASLDENSAEGFKKDILTIRRTIREKYSNVKGLSQMLSKKDANTWKEKFEAIEKENQVFTLINTVGIHNEYIDGTERSDIINSLKEVLL